VQVHLVLAVVPGPLEERAVREVAEEGGGAPGLEEVAFQASPVAVVQASRCAAGLLAELPGRRPLLVLVVPLGASEAVAGKAVEEVGGDAKDLP
jgi:hypothetical protein